jgi:enoyl-[acyl-carrier protein] reductase/trans-2-enoyl-CoA reductase (NAD+)
MDPETQSEINKRMAEVTEENLPSLGDLDGYRHDFLAINGFDVPGVDYEKDVARLDVID